MKNQYEYTINSTDDIRKAFDEAERENICLTPYNSAFHLRGAEGDTISVDDSLANLYAEARGPAVVRASGEGRTTVITKESAVVYATKGSVVDAYDSATVYAYDRSDANVSMDSSVYVCSNDVVVGAFDNARVYLPATGSDGSQAVVGVSGASNLIQPAPAN